MIVRKAVFALTLAGVASVLGPQAAGAADAIIYVPVGAAPYQGVPRVKPTSPVMRYPFGVLREDYTPYGMAGVPDRIYFSTRQRYLR
jgi:hypothetical protein